MLLCFYLLLFFVHYSICQIAIPPYAYQYLLIRTVKEHDLRGEIDEICPSYKISFSIFVNSYTAIDADASGSADFLHLTATGGDVVVFRTNQGGTFQLKTNLGSGINTWNSPPLPKQTWYNLQLEQTFTNNQVLGI